MSGADRIAGNAGEPCPLVPGSRRRTDTNLLAGGIAGKNQLVLDIRVQSRLGLAGWQSISVQERLMKPKILLPKQMTHKGIKRDREVCNIGQFHFGIFNIFNVGMNLRALRLF
jgi:hypothetical protein